jgi:hypothetical protein
MSAEPRHFHLVEPGIHGEPSDPDALPLTTPGSLLTLAMKEMDQLESDASAAAPEEWKAVRQAVSLVGMAARAHHSAKGALDDANSWPPQVAARVLPDIDRDIQTAKDAEAQIEPAFDTYLARLEAEALPGYVEKDATREQLDREDLTEYFEGMAKGAPETLQAALNLVRGDERKGALLMTTDKGRYTLKKLGLNSEASLAALRKARLQRATWLGTDKQRRAALMLDQVERLHRIRGLAASDAPRLIGNGTTGRAEVERWADRAARYARGER